DEETRLRAALFQMHEVAQRFFRTQLEGPEGAGARAYLAKRGLPQEAVAEFGLGFAPGGSRLARVLEKEGFTPEQLKAGGLALESQEGPGFSDRFRNRLMFPIASERGKLIAFAGRAAERSIHLLLEEGLHARVLSLPEGLDPHEFCTQRGGAEYEALLNQAPGYYYWLADRARQQFDARTAEGRVAAFRSLLPAINRVRDKIERVALVNDLADRLGVEPGLVLENFRRAAAERRGPAVAPAEVSSLQPAERLLLRLLMENEGARRELLGEMQRSGAVEDSRAAGVFRALESLSASGEPFDVTALLGRLEEPDRRLVTDTMLGLTGDPPDLEQGRAALRALESAAWEVRRKTLHKRIQEAEKAGKMEEALRLLQEKQELESRAARGL
ncbi:MAG: hypothetical protein HY236_01995, partial [Acidobacteria bacterium]|nr:hypothetical protein [Acidobacteriota bacterium]